MSLHRFFIDESVSDLEQDGRFEARLDKDDFKHLKAARISPGELVAVIDSSNDYFQCEVLEVTQEGFTARISSREAQYKQPFQIDLFQGLPKSGKLEEVVRHGTEIGVRDFYPVEFKRSVSRIKEKGQRQKTERLSKIAKSAAEQAGRFAIPEVHEPIRANDIPKLLDVYDSCVVFWEEAPTTCTLREALSKERSRLLCGDQCQIAVVVGPEGGISEDEIEQLQSLENVHLCTLGQYILRTETAGVVGCALVSYELGGMGADLLMRSGEPIGCL